MKNKLHVSHLKLFLSLLNHSDNLHQSKIFEMLKFLKYFLSLEINMEFHFYLIDFPKRNNGFISEKDFLM